MRALLLAAGIGSRLRPITDTTPKCLVPIHGRPLLDYWLDLIFEAGIERALLNTHWLAGKVEAHVAASRWSGRIDVVREPELLGTGGTIKANHAYFDGGPILVAHADNLTDFTVKRFLDAHATRPAGVVMTMLAFCTDDPSSCGILDVDHRGVVQGFHEKVADPPGNIANGAVYVLENELTAFISARPGPFADLSTEIIPRFAGRIQAWPTDGYHRDIGTPESLRRAHAEFTKRSAT
jgi:mannose-1-phosphate guanylyltransferase